MIRNTLFAVVALITSLTAARANTVEIDTNTATGAKQIGIFFESQFKKSPIGTFAYATAIHGWSEVYAGLTVSPTPWLQLALGAGTEECQKSVRLGGWIWAGKGRVSLIHFVEDGGSGRWHKTEVRYRLNSRFALGAVEKDFQGRGPFAEWRLDNANTLKLSRFDQGNTEIAFISRF